MLGKALKGKKASGITNEGPTQIEKHKPVEIAFVLDKSTSMEFYKDEAISGFNKFIAEQKKQPGEAMMSLRQFNERYQCDYDNVPMAKVKRLSKESFEPDGCTALYDAVGHTISEVMTRQSSTPENERPSRTLVVILTDGEENSSKAYSQHVIQQMVRRARETFGWEFILIGVGVRAADMAVNLGIDERLALECSGDAAGMLKAMDAVSSTTTAFRDTGVVPMLTGHKG